MEIFIQLKKQFATLGIKPDGKSNFNTKHLTIIFFFAFCFIEMSVFTLFESKSIMESGLSYLGATICLLNIFTFSSNILKRSDIFALIVRFENIIKKRLLHRANIYEKVNEKIEKASKILYVVMVKVTLVGEFMPKIVTSYWLYYTSNIGSDAFQQTYTMSMPFNWKTPIGYAITMSIQYGTMIFLTILCCCMLCFLGAACWLIIAMIEDIATDIHSLDEMEENRVKLKMKLCDIIQFHSMAKQFVNDFSRIYEIIITGYYLWSVSAICCTLLMLHIATSKINPDPVELLLAVFVVFWSFTQMFIFCDLGENMSNHFDEVDSMIYYCDWYVYPKEIQRILPIIMISAQQPVTLNGFANLLCMRDAFKKVANGGFSYFMMVRKMYH